MDINRTGLWGEIYAARFLRDNGFDLIAGNYRRRVGEIDIIAEKDGVTCFIECPQGMPCGSRAESLFNDGTLA